MNILLYALIVFLSYLLGCSNMAFYLSRPKGVDMRTGGSKNLGASNALVLMGWRYGVLVALHDMGKAALAVALARHFAGELPGITAAAGVACVLGHIFPVYYGFRGGKGVVTSAAMIALTDWRVFLLVLLTFAIVFAAKRIVSLASLICAALYPVFTFLFLFLVEFQGSPLPVHGDHSLAYLLFATAASLFIGLTVVVKHKANIGRLLRGEEKPIISKGKKG